MMAEEVRALEVGQTVRICSDSCEAASVECTVAACGGSKFLTYRSKGQLKRFAIRDYPGKHYRRGQQK